jgi:hypothetical protein
LKTLFAIGSDAAESDTLLLELGPDYCCYAFLNHSQKAFGQISYISFDEMEMEHELVQVLELFRNREFGKVIVCCAFTQALLVPQKYFVAEKPLTNIIYETTGQNRYDSINEWQMTNSYSLPSFVYDLLKKRFPEISFFHAYTPALKIYNGFVSADQVDIHFTLQHFRVLVKKDQQVQLAQTYSYKTPLDVVYFLLKICYEFNLDQSETYVVVSGLIDKDSALYNELHNYFLNLHFAQAPSYSLPENEHPHYYFTSLYNLAACVS